MKTNSAQLFSLIYFLFLTTFLFSQNQVIDSLKIELQNYHRKDTVRINILHDLAYAYRKKDKDTAMALLKEALGIIKTIDFKKGEAENLYVEGVIEAAESNYREGFSKYEQAINVFKSITYITGIAKCYKDMGIFMHHNGKQKQAIEYYGNALKILKNNGDKKSLGVIFFNLGNSYAAIGDYEAARNNYFKSLKAHKEIGNEAQFSSSLGSIANTYIHQSNYAAALNYYNQSLTIAKKKSNKNEILSTSSNMASVYFYLKNYDKAIETLLGNLKLLDSTNYELKAFTYNNLGLSYKEKKDYKTAYKYLKKGEKLFNTTNNKVGEAYALNNIGDISLEAKDYIKALEQYKQAQKICLTVDNKLGLCNAYLGLGKVYFNQGYYDNALFNALESKKLSVAHEFIEYQSKAEELLSKIYKNTGNYKKALDSHQRFKILNDSLFNKKNIEKIAQLEYEFKYKQALDSASIRELQLKKTVTATNLDLQETQKKYLWAVIGVLMVSIVLGSFLFYQKFKNIKTKNKSIITEQKLLRSQMTPHFVFNSLSVLQGMILNKEEKKSVSYLSKFSKLLRITLENSRDKTVLLSEEMIAVENYLALQNLENESYQYTVHIDDSIDTKSLKIPPMLIQPFIENAVEHAFLDQKEIPIIAIRLEDRAGELTCTITDNGIGIDSQRKNTNSHKKSLATTITSERLELLAKDLKMKGSVTVENRKKYNEKGTLVTLVIPYKTVV